MRNREMERMNAPRLSYKADTDEDIDPSCDCECWEKLKLWWKELRRSDINMINLEPRDKNLAKKFGEVELIHVNKRL